MIYLQSQDYKLVGWLTSNKGDGARSRELMTMPYAEYLETPEWNVTRKAALKAAGYRCQLCNADAPLQVHHRTYARRGVEIPEDLIALCSDCHQHFHENSAISETKRAG